MNCGLRFNGNPQLQIFDAGVTMVASGYTINGNPQIQTKTGIHGGVAQVPYPPDETTLPVPNCTGNAEKTGSSMSPGNYTGTFPPSGVNTLNSGVYCIYGDFRVNAKEKLSGSGVTIFMMTGGITWNGKGQIKLSAPNSGPYAGLLFFSPLSNTNRMTINGDSDSLLSGTIFMPAAPIEFNGSGQIQKSDIQLIGYTVQLGGTSDTQINYTANSKYQIFVPASIEISQ
ncbi:MAG: hypothetical protein FJZ96_14265 [Chloroflexi bacterium]|nr:hypothetical protein [Chloroflexota bacterium]